MNYVEEIGMNHLSNINQIGNQDRLGFSAF